MHSSHADLLPFSQLIVSLLKSPDGMVFPRRRSTKRNAQPSKDFDFECARWVHRRPEHLELCAAVVPPTDSSKRLPKPSQIESL